MNNEISKYITGIYEYTDGLVAGTNLSSAIIAYMANNNITITTESLKMVTTNVAVLYGKVIGGIAAGISHGIIPSAKIQEVTDQYGVSEKVFTLYTILLKYKNNDAMAKFTNADIDAVAEILGSMVNEDEVKEMEMNLLKNMDAETIQ